MQLDISKNSVSKMIGELLSVGMTEQSIAEEVQTSQPTIHRIKTGSNCKYELGKRIEVLHGERFIDSEQNTAA